METSTTEEGKTPLNNEGLAEKLVSLRSKLYEKAKKEPKYRFYALYDRIYRTDLVLCVPKGKTEWRECRNRRSEYRRYRVVGDGPLRLSPATTEGTPGKDVSSEPDKTGIYPEIERKTSTVGNPDDTRQSSADGDFVDPGS